MLPSEQQRNYNQRFIPLTAELIKDMLENEGLEYQTPPGGHTKVSDVCSLTSIHHNNANPSRLPVSLPKSNETCSEDESERNEDSDSQETHLPKCEPQYQFELADSDSPHQQRSKSSSEESSGLKSIINLLRSVERLNSIRDGETSVVGRDRSGRGKQADQRDACSLEFMSIKPSRRRLYSSSSDSLISTPSKLSAEVRDLSADNFYTVNQHWINLMVVPKSKTSFLMNQCKLHNYKANSCNAYYTPTVKDFMRDREALASLLARPRRQRNSRNVPW